jgi:formylglycine-generating enzyme required for sulfatase activity
MNCQKCSENSPDNYNFCGNCGYKVESQPKTCPRAECNRSDLPPEALFCPDCGTKLPGVFTDFTETVNNVNIEMVAVEGGTFMMGSEDGWDDEKPVHKVTVINFYIGMYPITQEQWRAVMGTNPSKFKGNRNPVESVSWHDCQEFIKKLNSIKGKKYRLPTEAEWEFAARGGNESEGYEYSGSDDIDEVSIQRNGAETYPVGRKEPNELGICDMTGNVREWCNDWWDPNSYRYSRSYNPQGMEKGIQRINRGGSWYSWEGLWEVSYRTCDEPDVCSNQIGFRLAHS